MKKVLKQRVFEISFKENNLPRVRQKPDWILCSDLVNYYNSYLSLSRLSFFCLASTWVKFWVGGEGRISSSSVPLTHPTFLFKVISLVRVSWRPDFPGFWTPVTVFLDLRAGANSTRNVTSSFVRSAAQPAKNCLIKNYWLTPNKYESYLCYLTLLLNFNESHHVIEKLLLLLLYSYTFFEFSVEISINGQL